MVKKTKNGFIVKGDGLIHDELELIESYSGLKFGPELEFFVVDKETLEPKDCLDKLAGLPGFGKTVKPELATQQIEITSDPNYSLQELERSLKNTILEVNAILNLQSAMLLPIALYDTASFTITPEPRYELLLKHLGESFRKNAPIVASDQINIGAENSYQAANIFENIRYFLPEITALAAASPFKLGVPNGVATNRLSVYDAAINKFEDLTGIPNSVNITNFFKEYAQQVEDLPVFQHPNMLYKYSRAMPQRGVAAEIRSLDKQATLSETMALYALTKSFVLAIKDRKHNAQESHTPFQDTKYILPSPFCLERNLEIAILGARKTGFQKNEKQSYLHELGKTLDSNEFSMLEPLFNQESAGNTSSAMVKMYNEKGLHATYHQISKLFQNDLKGK
jgi:gamma-glutamyl:cysteine ligase YbdK (ATP-grasp superfamily)